MLAALDMGAMALWVALPFPDQFRECPYIPLINPEGLETVRYRQQLEGLWPGWPWATG